VVGEHDLPVNRQIEQAVILSCPSQGCEHYFLCRYSKNIGDFSNSLDQLPCLLPITEPLK